MSWGTPLEGETLLSDRDGLRIRSIQTREQLNIAEARNISLAVTKYLSRRPLRRSAKFDYPWMLRLHKEMFGDVWEWAGQLRSCDVTIGVPWTVVGAQLSELADALVDWERDWRDVLEQSVRLHHRAVQIHPFRNGNGRWSRMLANIWLALHGRPVIEWPSDMGIETSPVRAEYLACIRLADTGEHEPLYELHKRFLAR
jgi:Fic-DOC domain mobile mystery protein B